jgi:T5SS/PEP-CTERM-associated repeat protein
MTGLPFFRPEAFPNAGTRALAVSAGGVVVGSLGVTRALRWVGGGTPDSISTGYATHITPDGSTIVGQARDSGTDQRTFRWRAGERTLIAFPGHGFSFPTDVSDNGNVVVGQSRARLGANVAFRWRNGPGTGTIEEVVGPPGATFVIPLAVSGDGNTVAGRFGDGPNGSGVFVWQAGTARPLTSVLAAEYGVDTTGVRIADLYGLSADARTLVVFATLVASQGSQFYRLRLGVPPVSERRWVDAGGGAFDEADNWDPQGAPGASETARFDLDAAYTVTGAAALSGGDEPLLGVGRIVIDAGTVDFSGVRFSVPDESPEAPALSVRFGGTARVVADTAFAVLVSVGQEPLPPGDPRVARLQVFNDGTRLGAGSVAVGDDGPGELFVGVGGRLESQTGYVGLSAPGEAIVGGAGSGWRVPDLEVGGGGRGVLRVEAGGAVETEEATVGAAVADGEASLVEVTGTTPVGVPSVLSVGEIGGGTLAMGFEGGGRVEVRSGGLLGAASANVHVGAGGPGAGALDVSGVSPGGVRSRALVGTLRVAVAAPGDVDPRDGGVGVTGGAFLGADRLDVGAADGGTAFVLVGGTDPAGTPSALGVGTLAEPGLITVGEHGRGEVLVSGGAQVSAGDVRLGPVSTVQILGTDAAGGASALGARAVRVGTGAASEEADRAELYVADGGAVLASELLVGLSGGPGLSRVGVSGRGPTERSILEAFDALGDGTAGQCVFGVISRAEAVVEGGGRLVCDRAEIGSPSAAADVFVADSSSALIVERTLLVGSASGEAGVLRLDGFGVADAVGSGTGPLDLYDVVVQATGRVLGQGIVIGSTRVEAGGVLAPGVFVDGDVDQERSRGARWGGTLTVRGRLDAEPGAVLVVPVAGADSTRQGRLRVRGRAVLGGILRLAFRDGYAPRTGDVLTPMVADTLAGIFDTVEVTGLAPGWTYAVALEQGGVVVRSESDGVPTTTTADAPAPQAHGEAAVEAFPNPFAARLTLRYILPTAGDHTVDLLDALGRRVRRLAEGARAAGPHEIRVDGAGLAPGVYVVRVVAADGARASARIVRR